MSLGTMFHPIVIIYSLHKFRCGHMSFNLCPCILWCSHYLKITISFAWKVSHVLNCSFRWLSPFSMQIYNDILVEFFVSLQWSLHIQLNVWDIFKLLQYECSFILQTTVFLNVIVSPPFIGKYCWWYNRFHSPELSWTGNLIIW